MKKSPFSEEQIKEVLKEAEAGVPIAELCQRVGVSGVTFYRWKKRYGGLKASEARRLHEIQEENERLRRIVAQQTLDINALKAVLSMKW